METFVDHINRKIFVNHPPQQIVSLVPSITELLFELGLNDQIAGITKYCIHPIDMVKDKQIVGGVEQLDIDIIRKLNPDLIIAGKEENNKNEIELLCNEFSVFVCHVTNYLNALGLIFDIGHLTGKITEAQQMITDIEKEFNDISDFNLNKKVTYIIWKEPYMTVNKDTFINSLIEKCGGKNIFSERKENFPIVSGEEIKVAAPDVILLSSEPYPFSEKHLKEFNKISSAATVKLVDGEMFSWYGSRMKKAPGYFKELFFKS